MRSLQTNKSTKKYSGSLSNVIGSTMHAILRKTVSLAFLWMGMSGIGIPNTWHASAMKASPHTFSVNQDDEEVVLKIKGDEYDHWVTNQHDFTVIRDETGHYKFAKLSGDETQLLPSEETAGNAPSKHTKTKNLRPKKGKHSHQHESHKRCRRRGAGSSCGAEVISFPNTSAADSPYEPSPSASGNSHRRATSLSKSIGTLKNLVILMKFKDHKNRSVPSRNDIEVLMNSETIDEELAPTGSLKMLYRDHSYGKLTIESEVTDWILLDETEDYYANGQAGLVSVFHDALRFALDALESRGFAFEDFDADGDGIIDSIAFLTSGYGAEWGSEDSSGATYEDRIWSHKWTIYGGWKSARTGIRVKDYFVSPSLWGTRGTEIGRVGVIAHETGHYLDLPDLYDTDNSGNGLGFFCMMGNSWGSDGSQLYPPEFSAWTKIQLGWTTPRTPSIGVENRVSRSEGDPTSMAPDQAFKIGDGEYGFPIGEYLLIEYRRTDLLIGGIAIYHIDEVQSDHDTEGYPDQIRDGIPWPYNGNHYKVALAQADGKFELEQGINQGDSEDLYTAGQSLLPSKDWNGPFPNTDTYQNGVVKRTGVKICVTSDVGGPYMTFLFADNNPNQPWRTLLSEDFEEGSDTTVSFESRAKVWKNNQCRGSKCAKIQRSNSALLITVESICLTELKVSFQFRSTGLKNGEKLHLEYSTDDGNNWMLLKSWTRGKRGTNTFKNKRWYSKSIKLSLANLGAANMESSSTMFRFQHTSSQKRVLIDNLKIEGKF